MLPGLLSDFVPTLARGSGSRRDALCQVLKYLTIGTKISKGALFRATRAVECGLVSDFVAPRVLLAWQPQRYSWPGTFVLVKQVLCTSKATVECGLVSGVVPPLRYVS